ncbi:MAG: DnaA/Hda family protein [Rhodocyclaceae bacterium]|nr:DnaA/Hda family protein [Rhodocyclaceae bacterium]
MTQLLLDIQPKPIPTLDNFIVGTNSELLAALRQDKKRVYVWGPTGCGKTHLLMATVRDAVVDDVHRLTEEEQVVLFRLFNQEGSLLLAGDQPPARLSLREDLRTRIAQCLVFEIRPLSDEDKLNALRHHAKMRAMQVSEPVFRYMLIHGRRDWPSLMGLLNHLDQISLEQHRVITLPLLKEIMHESGSV